MRYLKQSDPQWASVRIGKSPYTVASKGCLITSCSMITDFFGNWCSPSWLAQNLSFTPSGMLVWSSLRKKTNIHLEERFLNVYREDKILEGINDPNKASILEINYGWHFVLAVRKIPLTRHYVIIDPISGTKTTTLLRRYKVTGSALMAKNG